MSDHVLSTENTAVDVLHEKSEYSGKVYWLNIPPNVNLDFDVLRDRLRNRTIHRNLNIDDVDADHVPKIFQQEGKLTEAIQIKDINLTQNDHGSVLLGTVYIDEPYTIQYRNQDILILGTTTAKFLIFKFDEQYYIQYLCAREVAKNVAKMMRNELDDLGFDIQETQLEDRSIMVLQSNLNAELMDAKITDFPEPELTSLRMRGVGLEEGDLYDREASRGKIRSHMMRTKSWVHGEEKVLSISRDGLVRSYSKVTLSQYLDLLTSYVLPEIQKNQGMSSLNICLMNHYTPRKNRRNHRVVRK